MAKSTGGGVPVVDGTMVQGPLPVINGQQPGRDARSILHHAIGTLASAKPAKAMTLAEYAASDGSGVPALGEGGDDLTN